MNRINPHHCNLNIWDDLPDEIWDNVPKIYESMPGWIGFKHGIPYWFRSEDDGIPG